MLIPALHKPCTGVGDCLHRWIRVLLMNPSSQAPAQAPAGRLVVTCEDAWVLSGAGSSFRAGALQRRGLFASLCWSLTIKKGGLPRRGLLFICKIGRSDSGKAQLRCKIGDNKILLFCYAVH